MTEELSSQVASKIHGTGTTRETQLEARQFALLPNIGNSASRANTPDKFRPLIASHRTSCEFGMQAPHC